MAQSSAGQEIGLSPQSTELGEPGREVLCRLPDHAREKRSPHRLRVQRGPPSGTRTHPRPTAPDGGAGRTPLLPVRLSCPHGNSARPASSPCGAPPCAHVGGPTRPGLGGRRAGASGGMWGESAVTSSCQLQPEMLRKVEKETGKQRFHDLVSVPGRRGWGALSIYSNPRASSAPALS